MVLSIFAVLLVFAPWLTSVMESGPYTGLTFDYSGWGLATGFYTIPSYPLDTVAAVVYWLAIYSVIARAVFSIAGMISLYASGGKGKPTALLVLGEDALASAAFIAVVEEACQLSFRLGFVDLGGGDTATVVIGWGIIGEVLLAVCLLAVVAQLWSVLRRRTVITRKEAALSLVIILAVIVLIIVAAIARAPPLT